MSEAARLRRVHEQLERAVSSIAGGRTSVVERLADAWTTHLADLEPERMPPSLRADFACLRDRMQARLATGRLEMAEHEGIDAVKRLLAMRLEAERLRDIDLG